MQTKVMCVFILFLLIFPIVVHANPIVDTINKITDGVWYLRHKGAEWIDNTNTQLGLGLTLGQFITLLPVAIILFLVTVGILKNLMLFTVGLIVLIIFWLFLLPPILSYFGIVL